MLTFQEEHVRDIWEEVYPLVKAHAESTTSYRRHEPFNPSKDRYIAYNETGFLRALIMRDDGRLVGYFTLYVTTSMHSGRPLVTEDTFYIAPSHRFGRPAWRFLRFVEDFVRSLVPADQPVEILFSCEDDNTSGIKGLLGLLDYQPVIQVYSKLLPPRADSAQPSHEEAHAHVHTH